MNRLTLDLSAWVAHIGVPSIYCNIVFSQTIGPVELKFHVKTPYDKLAKFVRKIFWSHDQNGRHAHIW